MKGPLWSRPAELYSTAAPTHMPVNAGVGGQSQLAGVLGNVKGVWINENSGGAGSLGVGHLERESWQIG